MKNELIRLLNAENGDFVFIPPSLNHQYIETVLSDFLGKDLTISECKTTNLCSTKFGGVSNSGATTLRLSLELSDGKPLDILAKILSPDSVNIFKIDHRFNSRIDEINWARWWGKQDVPWVPLVYDTRADLDSREFWILREYFPRVGWCSPSAHEPGSTDNFSGSLEQLRILFKQVAALHAYSRQRKNELLGLFSGNGDRSGGLCSPQVIQKEITELVEDPAFLSTIGVTEGERRCLTGYCKAVEKRPAWVDGWDVVCVTADWKPDNIGVRDSSQNEEIVIFDWGTTRLAPMEEEMFVLLRRLGPVEEKVKKELVSHYLQVYAEETGHHIEYDEFILRIPWARFLVKLRYIISHVIALHWVPYQTRSRELIHLFIDLAGQALEECQSD